MQLLRKQQYTLDGFGKGCHFFLSGTEYYAKRKMPADKSRESREPMALWREFEGGALISNRFSARGKPTAAVIKAFPSGKATTARAMFSAGAPKRSKAVFGIYGFPRRPQTSDCGSAAWRNSLQPINSEVFPALSGKTTA